MCFPIDYLVPIELSICFYLEILIFIYFFAFLRCSFMTFSWTNVKFFLDSHITFFKTAKQKCFVCKLFYKGILLFLIFTSIFIPFYQRKFFSFNFSMSLLLLDYFFIVHLLLLPFNLKNSITKNYFFMCLHKNLSKTYLILKSKFAC